MRTTLTALAVAALLTGYPPPQARAWGNGYGNFSGFPRQFDLQDRQFESSIPLQLRTQVRVRSRLEVGQPSFFDSGDNFGGFSGYGGGFGDFGGGGYGGGFVRGGGFSGGGWSRGGGWGGGGGGGFVRARGRFRYFGPLR